ncbi:MAG: manganese efflux pump MntP family protein [Bacteroidales bacterium]
MSILEIILIAIGLSMDSLAVSIAAGIILDKFKIRNIFRIAFFMALFQGMMPLFGWLAGVNFKSQIEAYDHWIAFGLLSFLGIKMIREGIGFGKQEDESCFDPTKIATIISLSFATSIDALAVGVSFAFLQIKVILPVIIISITTFLFSFAGASFGTKFGNKYNLPMEIIGGIILIGIGLKILLEHTGFLG